MINYKSTTRGFTLIELLVVIGIIAILAAILLPALASAKRRGLRAQDIDNMRQQGQASFLYAGDFNDWFPIENIGAANAGGTVNYIDGEFYLRWIEYNSEWKSDPGLLQPGLTIPENYEPYNQNQGFLYAGKYLGNPNVLFCPALQDTALLPSAYSNPVFMSADSKPAVRCCYLYNPRFIWPSSTGNPRRSYQKTSQARQLDVFITDYMETAGTAGMPFTPNYWAQYPSKGIEVTFTDGSCKFINLNVVYSGSTTLFQIVSMLLQDTGNTTSYAQFNTIFNYCQNAH